MQKFYCLAAGGTGGHVFPAQALGEYFLSKGAAVLLTTDNRGLAYTQNFSQDFEIMVLPTASFAQGSLFKRLFAPFRILEGVWQAVKYFRHNRPTAVIGFGGYPALPSLLAARILRIPYYIHEQNTVLGRVNRLMRNQAETIACGLWPVSFDPYNTVYVGNPVREAFAQFQNAPLPEGEKFAILIFGGSQGSSAFSRILPEALAHIPQAVRQKLKIVQQVREGELDRVDELYSELGLDYQLAPFFQDLPQYMAQSHLVVARAGASTLAELQCIGRASILIPLLSAANDHQTSNARNMVEAGAAFLYDEGENSPQKLSEWIENMVKHREIVKDMGQSAHKLARPDATLALAKLIESERKL